MTAHCTLAGQVEAVVVTAGWWWVEAQRLQGSAVRRNVTGEGEWTRGTELDSIYLNAQWHQPCRMVDGSNTIGHHYYYQLP